MKVIGILGAGHIGKAVATQFLANGFQVLISNWKLLSRLYILEPDSSGIYFE
ncbi:MAG: hypothetical protein JWQ66_4350 [Mucilaginibacter sp.]|nr:hypothetical protein [Mucilaginibacter sp.]